MPVPSTIADLSATASSNYPQGSESPSTLDDYIRAQGAIIRQVSDAKADIGGGNASGTWPVSISGNAATATTANTATTATTANTATTATTANTANSGPSSSQFSHRNKIINGNFSINQRGVSGTVTLTAGSYGHDRFKAGASGCTYTFATVNNVTTLTITAGTLMQVIEGANLFSGTHTLSWVGTAQARIGSGSYGSSGIQGTAVGGTNQTIEFGTGTVSKVQYEPGSIATPFEHRPYGTELALCQRYYQSLPNFAFVTTTEAANVNAKTLLATMRASPTMTGTPASGTGASVGATGLSGYGQLGIHSAIVAVTGVTASAEL